VCQVGGRSVTAKKIHALFYECGGCGSVFLRQLDDELPNGYHGKHTRIGDWGAVSGEWFACSEACLLPAMTRAENG
jgi:hypothetical protein